MSPGRCAPAFAPAAAAPLCACGEKAPAEAYTPGLGESNAFLDRDFAPAPK